MAGKHGKDATEKVLEGQNDVFADIVNLFEVAWLTEEQLSMFQRDFRIVADYFVQMRKNRNYIPPDWKIVHVQEVLQTMAVLTQDTRFEDAYSDIDKEEKEAPKNMREVLDRVENRGIQKGMQGANIEDGYWNILIFAEKSNMLRRIFVVESCRNSD